MTHLPYTAAIYALGSEQKCAVTNGDIHRAASGLHCLYFIPLCDNMEPQSMQVLLTFAKGGQADEIQV